MATGKLKPPAGRVLDANGYVDTAWLAYFQALSDRIAELEARLASGQA